MATGKLVIAGPNQQAIHSALRTLEIPPHPFLRRGCVRLVTSMETLEMVRGLGAHWCTIPDWEPPEDMACILAAMSHVTRGTGRLDFLEAIARQLAWAIYHDS